MKFTTTKENPGRLTLLKKQASPEKLELVWDNWQTQPENSSASPNGVPSANATAFASSSYENIPSTPLSSTKTAKRWGLFGSKKAVPDTPTITVTPPQSSSQREVTKKKSRILKKTKSMRRTKSSADFECHTSGQSDFSTANYVPHVPATPAEFSYALPSPCDDGDTAQFSGTALYFTVDPAWDESQGDAHLYFLPSSGATIASEEGLRHSPLRSSRTSHSTTTPVTHGARSPKSIKSVVGSDNQTSFLFIE